MEICELREKYRDNNEVIRRLKKMLIKEGNTDKISLIKESIKKVEEEQGFLGKRIRRNVYKDLSKKNVQALKNNTVTNNRKTEKLPVEEVKKVVYKNARVVFDGKYRLLFNDDKDSYELDADLGILEYNNYNDATYDFNIIRLLKKFDSLNNTKLCDRYMMNELPVFYDMAKAEKTTKQNKGLFKGVKKVIKREIKDSNFKNIAVGNSKSRIKATIAVASLALISILGIVGIGKKQKVGGGSVSNGATQIETLTTMDNTTEALTEEFVTEESITTEIAKEEVVVSNVVEDEDDTIDLLEKTSLEEEEQEENTELKVGDIIELSDTDLYYASTDMTPRGNTSYLNSNKARVGLISIVYKGQVLEVVDNSEVSLEELESTFKAKYGDDVKVSVNFDLVDDNGDNLIKYVGWVNSDEITNRSKVLTR